MNELTRRMSASSSDAGISLVEVMVALLVFSIAAIGLAAGAMSINRITSDSRARQVATNLAAKDLDQVRTYDDPTAVQAATSTDSTSDPSRTFTITRTVSSVSAGGTDTTCGQSVNFAYRRVSVTVDWTGRISTTSPVRSDTILAPTLPSTDAGTGAISIRVTGADGTPRAGVAVAVTPVTDGKALSTQPDPTNADGCAYANRIVPGVYKLELSKTGYVDIKQRAVWSDSTVAVAAGSTVGESIQYDASATYTTNYAKNFNGTALLPSNLDTTFVPATNTYPVAIKSPAAATQQLFPLGGGYTAVAGAFADPLTRATTCMSMDPTYWPAGAVAGKQMAAGVRAAAIATTTFSTPSTSSIPMGVVKVSNVGAAYFTAVSATPAGIGNPGCSTTVTYTFPQVPLLGTSYLALPFGSWTIYQGTALGLLATQVPASMLSVQTNQDSNGVTGSLFGNVVTLDPRAGQ